jgi:hypothetical protein
MDPIVQYVQRFTTLDLKARGFVSRSDAIKTIHSSTRFPSVNEQRDLDKLFEKANQHLNVFPKLRQIIWKVVLFDPQKIEHGFPHTHGDTIFLPSDFLSWTAGRCVKTLIHEKIHVFQRLYPIETNQLLLDFWKLKVLGLDYQVSDRRVNPDTNEIIYAWPMSGGKQHMFTSRYNSKQPSDITDVSEGSVQSLAIPSNQTDHPFEIMACILTDICMMKKHDKDEWWFAQARKWLAHLESA